MSMKNQFRCPADAPDAVGIVVRSPRPRPEPLRMTGFVWGIGLYAAPSLPFGRWKPASQGS